MIVPNSPYLFDQWIIEPLGALYLAGAARRVVDEVSVRVWDEEPIPEADWYGVSVVTPHFERARQIIRKLRQAHPYARIIAGGAHCTFAPFQSALDLGADFVVAGEGELVMLSILNGATTGVPGIYTDDGEGHGLAWVPNLSDLPIPDHSLLQHEYRPNPAFSDDRGGAIMASRGCPYNCSYCGKSVGKKVRWRLPEQVAEEMTLYSQWRFEDDDIFGNKDWFERFCAAAPSDTYWRCSARAASITTEMLERASQAGCKQVGIGVETASSSLLKIHCPSKSVERNTEAVRLVKAAGIKVTAFLIAGLPGETEETIQETIDWIGDVQPDRFTVSACTPYPGSPLYNRRFHYGLMNLSEDFDDYQQLGFEDESVAFAFDTPEADRHELTRLWHKLREVARYGIAEKK